MRVTSNKTIGKNMTIPCKGLIVLHIYIVNDNNDYTGGRKRQTVSYSYPSTGPWAALRASAALRAGLVNRISNMVLGISSKLEYRNPKEIRNSKFGQIKQRKRA